MHLHNSYIILLKLAVEHGEALVKDTHNGYLASLEAKRATRDNNRHLEALLERHTALMGKKIQSLELQLQSLYTVLGRVSNRLKGKGTYSDEVF